MADQVPVELLTRESQNACVQAYTCRTKSLVSDPAGSVLYDFCHDHGITKLPTESVCFSVQPTPEVTYWIVKDAFQSFSRSCVVFKHTEEYRISEKDVENTLSYWRNWLVAPDWSSLHEKDYPARTNMVAYQCGLMMQILHPIDYGITETPSMRSRRLILYEDTMVKQLRRHRLLYALKDYLWSP